MVGRLATVISKLLGSVFGESSKSPLQKRIEWLRVNQDFHGGRYQVDGGGRSGQATVTGRNPGFSPGDRVAVVVDQNAPVAIVAHTGLKAQFHPTGAVVEEVEEIVVTRDSHPDGGLDFWLRSHRGLFYLDVRAAVEAVVPTGKFITGSTLFPTPGPFWPVYFGQKDNQFGIFVNRATTIGADLAVIYVFEIGRQEHSDTTPTSATVSIGGIEFPVLSIRLLRYYDLSDMSLDTGITATSTVTVATTQLLWIMHRTVTWIWNAGLSSYGISSTSPTQITLETIPNPQITETIPYSVMVDLLHLKKVSTFPLPPGSPVYFLNLRRWSIDRDGHPILFLELHNQHQIVVPHSFQAYDGTGQLVLWPTLAFDAVSRQPKFREPIVLAMRLTQASNDGGVQGVLIGRTCEPSVQFSAYTDELSNFILETRNGFIQSNDGNFKDLNQFIGGPQDGAQTVTWSLSTGWGSLPGASIVLGSGILSDGTDTTQSGKTILKELFVGRQPPAGPQVQTFKRGTSAFPGHYFALSLNSRGFEAALQFIYDGRMRDRSDSDLDVLCFSKMTAEQRMVLALWHTRAGADSMTLLREAPPVLGAAASSVNRVLNRDFVLLEEPSNVPRQLATLDGSTIIDLPNELSDAQVSEPLTLLAPDRLYDKREVVLQFRNPKDPASLLSKPKPLVDVSNLSVFEFLTSGNEHLVFHTVGTRTNK